MLAALALACGCGSVVAPAAVPWRDAPEYVALFAPPAHADAYTASVSSAGIDALVDELRTDPASLTAPGAWVPRPVAPLDAFGRSGPYDRWQIARLYAGRQPRVARGARVDGGSTRESWLLVSPYPSADLTRLESGTLRIVLRIAPQSRR